VVNKLKNKFNAKYVLNCIVKIVVGEKESFLNHNIKILDSAVRIAIVNTLNYSQIKYKCCNLEIL